MPTGWYDAERNIDWVFSHDRMLFVGRDPKSGAARGLFGRGGAGDETAFQDVPVVTEKGDLLTPHALYGLDEDEQALTLRFALDDGESFTAMPHRALGRLILLTNRRLIALREDQRAAAAIKPLVRDWEVALPGGPQHLRFVTLAEFMDGWLVSFVYGNGMRQIGFNQFNVVARPWHQVRFVDDDARASVVADRTIREDYPALHRTDWWLSPPLDVLAMLPEATLDKGLTWPMQLRFVPERRSLYVAAACVLLLSVGLAFWWLRRARVTRSRRGVWLVSCALLGLPALLSMFILEPRDTQP